MPEPAAPPGQHPPKNKRRQQLLIGGGALLVLLVLYMRSRSQGAAAPKSTTLDPSIDPSTGVPYSQETAGAIQPSTFADNGAQAGALGDSVTQLTGDLETLIQREQANADNQAAGAGAAGAGGSASTTGGASQPGGSPLTINIGTGPAKPGNPSGKPRRTTTGRAPAQGAIAAPYGPHKPPEKPGYTIKGTGSGNWWYIPKPAKDGGKRGTPSTSGGAGLSHGARRPALRPTGLSQHARR